MRAGCSAPVSGSTTRRPTPGKARPTIYCSLEPCGARKSRPNPCADRIRAAGIRRVVYAWREPPLFVEGHGADALAAGGVQVVEIDDLADDARAVNVHLF